MKILINNMRISVQLERFEQSWKPTGIMEKESPTTFVQTYKRENLDGRFKQVGKEKMFGIDMVVLEEVQNK